MRYASLLTAKPEPPHLLPSKVQERNAPDSHALSWLSAARRRTRAIDVRQLDLISLPIPALFVSPTFRGRLTRMPGERRWASSAHLWLVAIPLRGNTRVRASRPAACGKGYMHSRPWIMSCGRIADRGCLHLGGFRYSSCSASPGARVPVSARGYGLQAATAAIRSNAATWAS